jgi:fatty acid-binding protein DegV
VDLILAQMAESADSRSVHVAVFHADVSQEAEDLRRRTAERFECVELFVTEFTPVMGAHTGPGALGVAFYVE